MHILYARQPLVGIRTPSLFLAGPTPRSQEIASWRKDALILLRNEGFSGTVFVPEDPSGIWDEYVQYSEQVEWEDASLRAATCILFWIPRDLNTLPAYTTNIEFGQWMDSGKIVLGFPAYAPKMKYFLHYAEKLGIPLAHTLEATIKNVCVAMEHL